MKVLTAKEAEKIVGKIVRVPASKMFMDVSEALGYANGLGYPVVLKIVSPDLIHKTELKGVKIVHCSDDFMKEFVKLMEKAHKKKLRLTGIQVQEHVKGYELIIGLKEDATFGYVVMLGMGGVLVEVLKDAVFRACPVNSADVDSMLSELKMGAVLFGVRGEKKCNISDLKRAIVGLSKLPFLMQKRGKKLVEFDINPYILNSKNGYAVDVRIGMK